MADEGTTNPNIERALAREGAGIEIEKEDTGPIYRVLGDNKIPVSKHQGLVWQSRMQQGISARGEAVTRWDEAIRYYDNDQLDHRKSTDNKAGNTRGTKRLGNTYSETENVVFANCSIMVPMLYAKNPVVTITAPNDAQADLAKCVELLCNKLMNMRQAPGLNMKTKLRRSVLTALLTNSAFIKIGWTDKQESSEAATQELADLSVQLQNAKDKKTITEVEGKLAALEEKVDLLSPAGPFTRAILPHRIVVDPTAEEPDSSDANWMMEWTYLPTAYINAVYARKSGEQFVSVYEPTHIMRAGANADDSVQDEVNNFKLIKNDYEFSAKAYGYETQSQLDAAARTKIWYVWDRTTRRVYMFADNNWKWPIWVWDDPMRLPRFFPYFRLWFHESPISQAPKGEVTYYLDQQDAINTINSEVAQSRAWARRNVFYNKKAIKKEDVEAVLDGPDGTARGVDLEEGMKLQDAIYSVVPPSMKFPELFSTDSKFTAINRITGINDSMRGAQFKTNTTNEAVNAYQQNVDIRVDERTDLIEDFIGDIMWNIAMLCMMNWDVQDVTSLVGEKYAQAWQRINDPRQFDVLLNLRVVGGSSAKPNSREKKQQAVQLMQAFGQFANAAPAVIVVMVKMMERAFDEVVVEDSEWDMIIQSMQAALTKAGSGPGGEQGQPQGGGQPQTDEGLKGQIAEQIASLPPAGKQKLQELVQQGVPAAEALKQVVQQVKSTAG